MTERSRPWDGTATGDATDAPYDAGSEFARVLRALLPGMETTTHKGGIINGATGYSDGAASAPSANTVRIAPVLAFDQGTWYESDANVDFTVPTPVTSTRVDRIVLRKGWAAQTVRLTRIAGTEGAGAPAMTQIFGTTWDVPMWQASIATNGTITLIDERVRLAQPGAVLYKSQGAYTILPAEVGAVIVQLSPNDVTLPIASQCPNGARIDIKTHQPGINLLRQGGDFVWASGALTSVPMSAPGDDYTVRGNGVDTWEVT